MERINIHLVIDVRCLYSTALGNVKQDSGRRGRVNEYAVSVLTRSSLNLLSTRALAVDSFCRRHSA